MTVYVDKLNYEANGQCWNVDFSRLPPSEQNGALAALHQPLVPESLVLLTSLQSKYPSAFERVSALSTLPAPDLSQPMTPWGLMNSVSMLMAFLNAKMMELGIEVSTQGRQHAVVLSNLEMGLADDSLNEKLNAAALNAAGSIVSGAVSMGAGLGSFGMGGKSIIDSNVQNRGMKEVGVAKRETQDYQRQMEAKAANLQGEARAASADAQRLDGYIREADSETGLSNASRQNIDDEIAAKTEQVKQYQSQQNSYESLKQDAKHRSQDLSLTDAERNAAKKELDDLMAGENQFRDNLDDRIKNLRADVETLEAIKRVGDNTKQIKVEKDRLVQLQQRGVRTQAEDTEMRALEASVQQRAQAVADDTAAAHKRISSLKAEAERKGEAATALQKGVHDHVAARQDDYAEQERALGVKMGKTKDAVTFGSAGFQTMGASGQAIGAVPQMLGQEDQAQADHYDAIVKHIDVSRDAVGQFVEHLRQIVEAAMQSIKDRADQENQVTKAVSEGIRS